MNKRKCVICGDEESCKYYKWTAFNGVLTEHKGDDICNKHYNQLVKYEHLLDTASSKHEKREYWNESDIIVLKELYSRMTPMCEMIKILNRTVGSISSKAMGLGLTDIYIKPNSARFKAEYQDYDWCYERYVNRRMSYQEMADEIGATKRVIEKWCVEKHKLHNNTLKQHIKLTETQYQLIMFGLLGDGHIDKRKDQPMYIESHAENQKDYLYWKYNILKDLCKKEPTYKPPCTTMIMGKMCDIQGQHRLNTKIIDELKQIRIMKRKDIILELNEFGLSLHVLDDGYRSHSNWELCLAEYTQKEIDLYIGICKERFELNCYQSNSDGRYIKFDAISSRIIDEIILRNIPNELDIVKYKITENKTCKPADYIYIVLNNGNEVGLNAFCRKNNLSYLRFRNYFVSNNINKINEKEIMELKEVI